MNNTSLPTRVRHEGETVHPTTGPNKCEKCAKLLDREPPKSVAEAKDAFAKALVNSDSYRDPCEVGRCAYEYGRLSGLMKLAEEAAKTQKE